MQIDPQIRSLMDELWDSGRVFKPDEAAAQCLLRALAQLAEGRGCEAKSMQWFDEHSWQGREGKSGVPGSERETI